MKRFMMLVSGVLISTTSFAEIQSNTTANALGSAWKAQQTLHAKQTQNEFSMVYGGEDISRKPTLVERTTTA